MAGFVVAVDGPSGSGKSSVCKEAARRLGFGYLDTGAGYRAFALHASRFADLDQAIRTFDYTITMDPTEVIVKVSGEDVSQEIRTSKVAQLVIPVSREVRVRNLQRDDARSRIDSCERRGIIVEGRDITTVVCPEAEVRVLLTADAEVRLARRSSEESESPSNQIARDSSDSKVAEFLKPADGVTLIDTTHLDFEQSVQALLDEIARAQ